jgi:hypothetical protein
MAMMVAKTAKVLDRIARSFARDDGVENVAVFEQLAEGFNFDHADDRKAWIFLEVRRGFASRHDRSPVAVMFANCITMF